MTADGDIDTKRVYEQLALTGKGNVDLANPIATAGLRNLDGFDGLRGQGRRAARQRPSGRREEAAAR